MHADHHHHHPHHDNQHQHHGGLAEMLDLDAVVLREFHAEIVSWVKGHVPDAKVIVDIGAGTGAGTFQLLAHFPDAHVVAVDSSDEMLHRLDEHAAGQDRVRTVVGDLDHGWPHDVPKPDLVWASNSMHHMADPAKVLRAIHDALPPGGVLALLEIEGFPRFLADTADAEVEERCHEAMARRRAVDMPHMGDDWGAALAAAGFEVRDARRFTAHLTDPDQEATAQYARATFERMRDSGDLPDEDMARLAAHRTGLTVRAERLGWIAVRQA
ncbi:class I SAM-dependent methyltransferase [Dactylosporangium darangshiense]